MTMRRLSVPTLVIALVASPAVAAPVLTPDGYGDLRIGMNEVDPLRLLGAGGATPTGDPCHEIASHSEPGLQAMFENRRLSRLALTSSAMMKTDAGVAIGSSEASVYNAYPGLRSDGGFIDDGAPWQDLFFQPHG